MNANDAVVIQRLGKTFPSGTEALAPFDLRIATDSFVSLVGPSGCGKSTLLRLIAGLSEPTTGSIVRSWTHGPAGIGYVFQDPTLMPWATAAENVALPTKLAPSKTSGTGLSSNVQEALKLVGLGQFSEAYPRELSGGMRMRVSIARAIVARPKVLLLDEPFAALDEFTRFQLNTDLLALWRLHQWTVIFVTHSVREAVFLSNRIVVFSPRPGRIVADLPIIFDGERTDALRDTHAFSDMCARVGETLRHSTGAP